MPERRRRRSAPATGPMDTTADRRSRPAPLGDRETFRRCCGYKPLELAFNALEKAWSWVMNDSARTLLAELEALAAGLSDPARREEVRRIIARLSDGGQEWPDEAE